MSLFTFLSAFFICFVWLEFLRRLDVFEPEKWKYILLATGLGALTVPALLIINLLPGISELGEGEGTYNLIIKFFFKVGLLEELVKIVPLFYMVYRTREVDEPYDFLKYAMCSALGFATVENIAYFATHGGGIIDKRAYLSVVGHLTFTCTLAYGINRKQMFGHGSQWNNILKFGFLSVFLHALFDILLSIPYGSLFFIGLFYFMVIWLRNMINTALNFSPYFTPVHKSKMEEAYSWLFFGLIAVFGFACLSVWIESDLGGAINFFLDSLILSGTLIFFLPGRLSKIVFEKGQQVDHFN